MSEHRKQAVGVRDTGTGADDEDIRGWRERAWLGAHSLGPKGKAVVVIRDVKQMLVQGPDGKKSQAVIYFQGLSKGMILNSSAFERLFALFPDPSMKLLKRRLVGQTIGLCIEIDKLISKKGQKGPQKYGPCLRVWPKHIPNTLSAETIATLEEMNKRMQSAEDAESKGGVPENETEGEPAPGGPEIPSVVDEFPS